MVAKWGGLGSIVCFMPWIAYILPLVAAFLVSLASVCIKKAIEEGAGITRVSFIINWAFFLCVLPTLFFGDEVKDWSLWYWPVIGAVFAFLGGLFILLSIRAGAVSIQASLMGTKAIFVGVLSVIFLAKEITTSLWIAAIMAFVAILILSANDLLKARFEVKPVLYALLCSFWFACTDVIVSREAADFGMWPFLNVMLGTVALLSFMYVPFFKKQLLDLKHRSRIWILLTSIFISIQYTILLYTLGVYKNATAINIIYSSRGLWAIVIVLFIGHWFNNQERHAGTDVIVQRVIGSLLMCLAIVIVLTS